MYFRNFKSGDKVNFNKGGYYGGSGDFDFTGEPSSIVPVSAIEGARVLVMLEDGYSATGEFKVIDGKMQAVVTFNFN